MAPAPAAPAALAALLWSLPAAPSASYAEFFGASARAAGAGNQAGLDPSDPSNNYYVPALLALGSAPSFSATLGSVHPRFEPIEGVVVRNGSNSDGVERGPVPVDHGATRHGSFHLGLPLGGGRSGIVGVSFFSPLGVFVEAGSTPPLLPEYVMYRHRYRRVAGHANYARALGPTWAASLGAHMGLQSTVTADTQTSLNGAAHGSSTGAGSKVSPSLGVVASVLKDAGGHLLYLAYQQEMKSNLEAHVFGEINDPTGLMFDVTMETMLYYDPHIIRAGWMRRWGRLASFVSVERQLWGNYRTPVVRIRRNSGIMLPSDDLARVEARDVTVPKLGVRYALSDAWSFLGGVAFRPTPLSGDRSGNGNSLDADSVSWSAGAVAAGRVLGKRVEPSLSLQYRVLEGGRVAKAPGEEGGGPGERIGSPGYGVGGRVLTAQVGVTMVF